jgi:hypothetical protein
MAVSKFIHITRPKNKSFVEALLTKKLKVASKKNQSKVQKLL